MSGATEAQRRDLFVVLTRLSMKHFFLLPLISEENWAPGNRDTREPGFQSGLSSYSPRADSSAPCKAILRDVTRASPSVGSAAILSWWSGCSKYSRQLSRGSTSGLGTKGQSSFVGVYARWRRAGQDLGLTLSFRVFRESLGPLLCRSLRIPLPLGYQSQDFFFPGLKMNPQGKPMGPMNHLRSGWRTDADWTACRFFRSWCSSRRSPSAGSFNCLSLTSSGS